ncbi:hypothetical protein [Roseomonas mucosa]
MSRHDIPARQPGLTIAIGWDRPMDTFFAQVLRDAAGDDAEDTVLLWLGGEPGAVSDPAHMIVPRAPYAGLTQAHLAQLRADRTVCPTAGWRSDVHPVSRGD